MNSLREAKTEDKEKKSEGGKRKRLTLTEACEGRKTKVLIVAQH